MEKCQVLWWRTSGSGFQDDTQSQSPKLQATPNKKAPTAPFQKLFCIFLVSLRTNCRKWCFLTVFTQVQIYKLGSPVQLQLLSGIACVAAEPVARTTGTGSELWDGAHSALPAAQAPSRASSNAQLWLPISENHVVSKYTQGA